MNRIPHSAIARNDARILFCAYPVFFKCFAKKSSISFRLSGLPKPGPPWPLPLTTCSVTSTPDLLQRVGQQLALLQRHDVVLVAVHDEERGGVLSTYVSGLAFRAFSLFSCAGPPISRATGEPGGSPSTPMPVNSVGPNQSTTHCTRLD